MLVDDLLDIDSQNASDSLNVHPKVENIGGENDEELSQASSSGDSMESKSSKTKSTKKSTKKGAKE